MPVVLSASREAARRLVAGCALTLAASVGLGDDVRSAPDARLGARVVRLDLPHLGTTEVQVPRATPTGVVLLFHRGATTAERAALAEAVPWHVLLVEVDAERLEGTRALTCRRLGEQLEDISRRAQRDAGLTAYLRPVVVSTADALPMARAAVAAVPLQAVPAAVSIGLEAASAPASCEALDRHGEPPAAWAFADTPRNLRAPLEAALATATQEPPHEITPIQRWLQHFDLPLTAAWSSQPRAMLVLVSSARGWRQPEEALAHRLADAGVHVVGIDALRAFWQRRSPRDVALELQRLTDALASAGLPVYIGGREFGAETIAVAGDRMAPTRRIAGVVLVDPGPTAFFEVEPPALPLRAMSPSDWSTQAAVAELDKPTLCVTHAAGADAGGVCRSLSADNGTRVVDTGADPEALATQIATFVKTRRH
ncbi:AcvB/VirJ family lysyl-phosphatidylglycerol hydrolase [Luteitalea sp.]|jgi:type IV secretory pathway VirJ component|uniref:AcvB/VirJ family lysyl-phosphatidylglycerol hydrolase n=1 Tax=Luteitalea sp. TaxID=2004800 RepID=UPI0037C9C63C